MADLRQLRDLFRGLFFHLIQRVPGKIKSFELLPVVLLLASETPGRAWFRHETERYIGEARPCTIIDVREIYNRLGNVSKRTLLRECVLGLGEHRPRFGRLKFDRVAAGLLATSGIELDAVSKKQAENDLLALLRKNADIERDAKRLIPSVEVTLPFVGSFQLSTEAIHRRIVTRRILTGKACKWYRTALKSLGHSGRTYTTNLSALLHLSEWQDAEAQAAVLYDALLEDLREQYRSGLRARFFRVQNASILVDNADLLVPGGDEQNPMGEQFLVSIADARERYSNAVSGPQDQGDPALVVAFLEPESQHTDEIALVLDDSPQASASAARLEDWQGRRGTGRPYYFYKVDLPSTAGIDHGLTSLFPSDPLPKPRPRRSYYAVVGALVLCAAAVVATAVIPIVGKCAPGVYKAGAEGQCIGATIGDYSFSDSGAELSKVVAAVKQENDRVSATAGNGFVSIAYYVPLPSGPSPLARALRHELDGVLVAQKIANQPSDPSSGSPLPAVKVLIVNTGPEGAQWDKATDLVTDLASEEHLVAVGGLGQSNDNTRQAIGRLRDEFGLPLVASRLTANDLRYGPETGPVDGLYRVAPSNSDQAEAMASLLKKSSPQGVNAILVQDTYDAYARDLGSAFQSTFPEDDRYRFLSDPFVFSSAPGTSSIGSFTLMASNICFLKPQTIYFAGRGPQLRSFISTVTSQQCTKPLRINIVTGDDAVDLVSILASESAANGGADVLPPNVSVRYTALAHPQFWAGDQRNYGSERTIFEPLVRNTFLDDDLSDGAAMMGFDCVWTIARAARLTSTAEPYPSAGAINETLKQLNGANAVGGVSGWISLSSSTGTPEEKAVPVLSVQPNGQPIYASLTSRSGAPYVSPLVR